MTGRQSGRFEGSSPSGPLAVAVAQPVCVPGDVAVNLGAHAAAVARADARLVVFPELSLTGYLLDAPPLELEGDGYGPIDSSGDWPFDKLVTICGEYGTTALVGAPIRIGQAHHIATLAVSGQGARLVYRKRFLGEAETSRYEPGPGPAVVHVEGWRVGVGICKDTRMMGHIDATLALGIHLYAAGLVHAPGEAKELETRSIAIAERGEVPVAFASAAGENGPRYPLTAGRSEIRSADGRLQDRAGADAGELCRVVLR